MRKPGIWSVTGGVISQESVVAHDYERNKDYHAEHYVLPTAEIWPQTTDVRWISERSRIEVKRKSF
jgi:hypothetical protein